MPAFILDTAGTIANVRAPSIEAIKRDDLDFEDLDAFTQGYIEAMFFTSTGDPDDGDLENAAFADLAPETLTTIIADCAAFQAVPAYAAMKDAKRRNRDGLGSRDHNATQAGRDFWFTHNGHGVGFWDGDWPEPHASDLDRASKAFPSVDLYRGDDGKLYL